MEHCTVVDYCLFVCLFSGLWLLGGSFFLLVSKFAETNFLSYLTGANSRLLRLVVVQHLN